MEQPRSEAAAPNHAVSAIREIRRSPPALALWAGSACSSLGDWMALVTLAVALVRSGGGPAALVLLFVLQFLPSAVLGLTAGRPLAGADRRRAMLASSALRAAALLTFLVRDPSVALVEVLGLLVGGFGAPFAGHVRASVADLPGDAGAALGRALAGASRASIVIGPLAGGFAVSALGLAHAGAVVAAVFVLAAAAMLAAPSAAPGPEGDGGRSEPSAGPVEAARARVARVRELSSVPLARALFMVLGLAMAASAVRVAMEPLFVLRTLGRGPAALGLLVAAWGGGVVLAPSLRSWTRRAHPAAVLAAPLTLAAAALVVAAQLRSMTPVLVLWFAGGVGNGVVSDGTLLVLGEGAAARTREAILASMRVVLDGGFLGGAVLGALVGESLDVRWALAASGAAFLLAAVAAIRWRDAMSQFDLTVPPALEAEPAETVAVIPRPEQEPSEPVAVVPEPSAPAVAVTAVPSEAAAAVVPAAEVGSAAAATVPAGEAREGAERTAWPPSPIPPPIDPGWSPGRNVGSLGETEGFMADAERERLRDHEAWRQWGPYLSERAWGTVREDYSPDGRAWDFFPHDHARSRAYRWNEDGLGGVCDIRQLLCFAFAFWNGRDPILKERIFGLTGEQGNHGEDAKEYWWFLDSTPTHSWMRWRYWYPQREFPYARLLQENARRTREDPEFELLDTGMFDEDRYWDITVDYAKASPEDLCIRVRVRNAGPDAASLHVLPTLWFRNVWSWMPGAATPQIHAGTGGLVARHEELGKFALAGDGAPQQLFCDNESNARRLWGVDGPRYPKDGINDRVVLGAPTVNLTRAGTKAALWYRVAVPPGGTAEIRLRLADRPAPDLGATWEMTMSQRESEADEFYASLAPEAGEEDRAIMRQALGGMLWSKQFYHYNVERWLDGDPGQPVPPPSRESGRNAGWRHVNNLDVLSMPDPWEYPWYAAWDLAFHTVTLARVDPEFAKHQLILLCREWYMHPNGQLPAYEWAFGDVNPPVHAWAALRVFEIDGGRDYDFLERVLHKLLINFTWWVNRKDTEGYNVFEGGFLGLDNIGPFDRSAALPLGGHLEQSDATAWMAMYCLNLLEMALVLAEHDPTYEDLATKFFEHFCYVASAMNEQGLWNEEDGFYEDVLHTGDGRYISLHVRSIVGLIPLCATTTLGPETLARLPDFAARLTWFAEHRPEYASVVARDDLGDDRIARLLSIVSPERLVRILETMLDPEEFLSDHGLRALSKFHEAHPLEQDLGGGVVARVDYEPGESTSGLFGGNSNWRGPVWFPVNYLLIEALRRFHRYLREDFLVEYPAGSGNKATLLDVSNDLARRLVSLFSDDAQGRRPVFGPYEKFQTDPAWHGVLPFHEYFHGETGMGLGASHQTGWTGLVADLIIRLARNEGVD